MKRSRLITAAIVLLAAMVSCICSLVERVSFGTFVTRLALTVVIFIIIAFVIEIIIDWNFKPPEEEKEEADEEETEEEAEEEQENIETANTEDEEISGER